ncbi:MAG: hypothetical protein JO036_14565 [Candidatus Eremiobacteraeota bacterium]|nr:hypothetical protein [Candidatus Eremiobacteraeota bacterium]
MDDEMTLENALVTFDKRMGPGVLVHITGIPAEIVRSPGKGDLTLFDMATSGRLQHLLRVARRRVEVGETDVTIDFTSDA